MVLDYHIIGAKNLVNRRFSRWYALACCVALLQIGTSPTLRSQTHFKLQHSDTTLSLRGMSAVNQSIAWASGTGGRYLRTTDGGRRWQIEVVPGADSLDFRDIESFNEATAYLLSSGSGDRSRIYKTTDAGRSWQLQFKNDYAAGFFDGMAFWNREHGIAYGDPLDGTPYIIRTDNGGAEWARIPPEQLPRMADGEYGFAASGTGIRAYGGRYVSICTGGEAARILTSSDYGQSWRTYQTPLLAGKQTTGIFSIAFRDAYNAIVVGGDYAAPAEPTATMATTSDGGKTWQLPSTHTGEPAFRSCVVYLPGTEDSWILAVGSHGVSLSQDDGVTWQHSDSTGFHTMAFGVTKQAGWAAGSDGRIAKIVVP